MMTVLNTLTLLLSLSHLSLSLYYPSKFNNDFKDLQVDSEPETHADFAVGDYMVYPRDMDPSKCAFNRIDKVISFNCAIDKEIKITAEDKYYTDQVYELIIAPVDTQFTVNVDTSNWSDEDFECIPENEDVSINQVLEQELEPYTVFLVMKKNLFVHINTTLDKSDFYATLDFPFAVDVSRIRDRMMII